MRIAITADLHLTTRDRHPERYETLEDMLADLRANAIDTLIVAGDLFDAESRNYSEFENVIRDEQNRDMNIFIIPGNHDPSINNNSIAADNRHILTEPALHEFDSRPFLFMPYQAGKTMGEALAEFSGQLPANEWVLVGHGDWIGGIREPNASEPGVYMPLTRRDIEIFQPARVFLGHIHAPMDTRRLHYVGSPCGLNINETGRRRCLVYETGNDEVTERTTKTPILYFDESFVVIPGEDEARILQTEIEDRIQQWVLSTEEQTRTSVRVKVSGYSINRAALRKVLLDSFNGFAFYQNQEPNIENVSDSYDIERQYIAERVRDSLLETLLPNGADDPNMDEIMIAALRIIYGV